MLSMFAERTAAKTRNSPEFVTEDAYNAEYIFVVGACLPDLAKALRHSTLYGLSGPGTCRCSAGDRRGHAKATHPEAVLGWTGWARQRTLLGQLAEIFLAINRRVWTESTGSSNLLVKLGSFCGTSRWLQL